MPSPFFASLSGIPIVAMTLVLPYSGVWHADIRLDRAIGPTAGPQILTLSDLTMTCAVVRSVDFAGARCMRVVGGTGGWRTTIPPLQYQSPTGVPVALVSSDAAGLVQELQPIIGPTIAPVTGPTFVRQGGAASLVLQSLFGDQWWMDPTGAVQVVPRLPTPIVLPFDLLDARGPQGLYRVSSQGDILTPWVPGAVFLGPTMTSPATINRVTHTVDGRKMRTDVSAWP